MRERKCVCVCAWVRACVRESDQERDRDNYLAIKALNFLLFNSHGVKKNFSEANLVRSVFPNYCFVTYVMVRGPVGAGGLRGLRGKRSPVRL